jgi:hypothetical protein
MKNLITLALLLVTVSATLGMCSCMTECAAQASRSGSACATPLVMAPALG